MSVNAARTSAYATVLFGCLSLVTPAHAADATQILADHCYGCHSADVKMSGLDLTTRESILKGGEHGPAIIPGKSAESRLYLMITGKVPPSMPLGGNKLAAADIEALKTWIDDGAKTTASAKPPGANLPSIKPKVDVPPQTYDLAWSPDGNTIALAGYKEVHLLDPATKHVTAQLTGGSDAIRALAFSRDGALLAAAGGLPARGGEVLLWDVRERKLLRTLKGHGDCIYAVAFAPDGMTLATSSYDKLIKIWDVATGKEIRTLQDHIDAVYSLAFTLDGKRLISGAADRTVKIWNVATGERLYTLSEPQDGINAVALDPTGKYVAAAGLDKTIRIWSLGDKSGHLENSLIAHEDAIVRLAWSPDGKQLATASADKTVKVFSVPDLNEVESYKEPDWVYGLQFSPDGKKLAIAPWNHTLEEVSTR